MQRKKDKIPLFPSRSIHSLRECQMNEYIIVQIKISDTIINTHTNSTKNQRNYHFNFEY
jgi:hypothetical protein